MYVDDIELAGKEQNIDPLWNILMKDVDLENRHHTPTMLIWVALKENVRQAQILQIITGAINKLPCSGKSEANISSWSQDMERHAKKCVEGNIANWRKTTQQS